MIISQIEDHTFFSDPLSHASVVLDLGANHGAFAHAMIGRYGCRVHAIEANPELCRSIVPHPNLHLLNVAVAGQAGVLPFYISAENDEASSIVADSARPTARRIDVPSVMLSDLIEQYADPKIDLLKVDIEGAEIEMFDSTSDDHLRRCSQITVEFHDFCGIITADAANRVVSRMRNLGFDVIQMWMRSHGDTLFVNRSTSKISALQIAWNRHFVRNSWWAVRKIRTKLLLQPK